MPCRMGFTASTITVFLLTTDVPPSSSCAASCWTSGFGSRPVIAPNVDTTPSTAVLLRRTPADKSVTLGQDVRGADVQRPRPPAFARSGGGQRNKTAFTVVSLLWRCTGTMSWLAERRRRSRFEAVVLPHLDAAYALARWLTRNDADADDVVQEAVLRAYRYFDSYRDGDAKSWLLKIVRRTTYSWLECNRPAASISLGDAMELEEIDGVAPEVTSNLETLLSNRSELLRLDELIGALPAPLREKIVLRELQEMGYREIAEITGVPIGTVMSRLHRARTALRQAWNG
jgi:RNA polymerase sigma-70 factor, ECF subfamily